MTTFGNILKLVAIATVFIGMPALLVVTVVRRIIAVRRDREALHNRVQLAIEKITADGKVEGPKGPFVWRRWGAKWLNYSNSLPAPNCQKRMPTTRDFPRYPHKDE